MEGERGIEGGERDSQKEREFCPIGTLVLNPKP
jgi:hypothetical protein